MARKTNPTLIGAFVLGAVVLAAVAAMIWGSRSLFESKSEYVCYFPGSVNGLARGAAVKFRGVEIGSVKEVRIRYQQRESDKRIPVFIEIWEKRLRELGAKQAPTSQRFDRLIAEGMRARLESQSIVTGVLQVSLDFLPGTPIALAKIPGSGGPPEIPTVPTDLEEATKSVTTLLDHLKAVDAKGTAEAIAQAAWSVRDLARNPELESAMDRLPSLVAAARALIVALNGDATKTLASVRTTFDGASGALAAQGPLSVDLRRALSDFDKAAIAVRDLADFLRRNPHAIVAGTKKSEEKK